MWLWKIGPHGAAPDGTLTNATDWVNAVAFSPDGAQLAAGAATPACGLERRRAGR